MEQDSTRKVVKEETRCISKAKHLKARGRKNIQSDQRAPFVTPSERSRTPRQNLISCSRRHTFQREHDLHTGKTYRIDWRTYFGSAPSNIHDAYKAARSASLIHCGELTDQVPKNTITTEQQRGMVPEQVLIQSDGEL